MSARFLRHLLNIPNLLRIFATSEGRNPRVKNAFLALSFDRNRQNFCKRIETEIRPFCMYMIVRVQPTLCFAKCIQQRGVFVSV